MGILIKTVRVAGFRGLENFQIDLEKTTVLTGMNNSGKTSLLKAIQIALGNGQFLSPDDFFIQANSRREQITIDLYIVPLDGEGNEAKDFHEDWEMLLTTERIRTDGKSSFVPLRTICMLDSITSSYKIQQFILSYWPELSNENIYWYEQNNGRKTRFYFDEISFFYIDAQRDIIEDTKQRTSYLGKLLANIEYSEEDIAEIETQIQRLNEKAVSSSDVLSNIKDTLKGLDSAMSTPSHGIEITPFTKKIRDLNKGLSIYYGDDKDGFSMEYHGMGTRSWSSLLTLKSFINQLSSQSKKESRVFFPVLAIEEPEAHLHPNAQKKLFGQIDKIAGQKIISTHSPYIAATAELKQIRSFYKNVRVECGSIEINNLNSEEIRKINRQVTNHRGEIFFSKLIVFLEGETEEQALPIFAKHHFYRNHVEIGLDFVGVGSHSGYLPFIRFAEGLNIPWLIFSDAEEKVKSSVMDQLRKLKNGNERNDFTENVVYLDDGHDFERQLITDGFQDEIRESILSFDNYENENHKNAKLLQRQKEVANFDDDQLYKEIKGDKTKYGPAIAERITVNDKQLSPKIILLFEKIKSILKLEGANA